MKLIDASPIGINVRSTVATYANIHDELRKSLCKNSRMRKNRKYKAGDFSYNTGKLRCPVCDGTGSDQSGCTVFTGCGQSHARNVAVPGTRQGHGRSAMKINRRNRYSLPELMEMDVQYGAAVPVKDLKLVHSEAW